MAFSATNPLSPFGEYLVQLCRARSVKVSSLADVVGGKTRLSFSLRGSRPAKGRRGALLTIDELDAIAKRLKANRHETRRLLLLGLLEHAPAPLRSCVVGMTHDLVNFAARLNAQIPNLDFKGGERDLPEEF